MDICFDQGKDVDSLVLQRFGCSVSSTPSPSSFVLVASFGRSSILSVCFFKPPLVVKLSALVSSISLVGCSVFVFIAKKLVFSSIILSISLASNSQFSFIFGVMEVPIGKEILLFGVEKKRLSGQLLERKNLTQMQFVLVLSHLLPKLLSLAPQSSNV